MMYDRFDRHFIVSILLYLFIKVFSAPPQYCVEETKNRRLQGIEPYADQSLRDARRCISKCIKDVREGIAPCKAVVYTQLGGNCRRYLISVSTTFTGISGHLEQANEHEGVAYYELLTKCPNKAVVNEINSKRRDDVDDQQVADEELSRPFDERQQDHNQPGVMPEGLLRGVKPPHHMEGKDMGHEKRIRHMPGAEHGQSHAQHGVPAKSNDDAYAPPPQSVGIPQTVETRPVPGSGCCSLPQAISCCPQPQPQSCCPAPQPQPCCAAPQPQPCYSALQPQPCYAPQPQPQPCCPAPQPSCCPATPPPQWGSWSSWTDCQQIPCALGGGGGTFQTRTRTCQGQGSCQGESQQQQPCGCLQGQWTEWGPPTQCSRSCGPGIQTKPRTCTVPGTCQGPDSTQQPCNLGPCAQWSNWGSVEQCPVTCGQGSTGRRRQCTDGQGNLMNGCPGEDWMPEPCGRLPPCCQPWTPWSSCSSTCGQGTQSRSMTCDGNQLSREHLHCQNPTPCCTEWLQWGNCQVVCGQGYQTRTRSCGGQTSSVISQSAYGSAGLNGNPSLPSTGGCCNQQQACSVGCSPNTFYQQQKGYFNIRKRKRSIFNNSTRRI